MTMTIASTSPWALAGGAAGTTAVTPKPVTLGPGDLSLPELMLWLNQTLQKSDSAIRVQMADINEKKDYAAQLGSIITALKKAEGIKSGETGRDCSGLPNLSDYADQPWFQNLPQAAKDNYKWVADDTLAGGDRIANENAVKAAREALTEVVSTLTSQNDTAMIRLQSAIASRSQAIQLISNMVNVFNETAKSTVGNIR